MPTDPTNVTREHVTEWMNFLLGKWKASTAANRYRGIDQFFKYLVEADEINESPMAKMKPPKVEEMEVPVITDDDLLKLFKVCAGKDFTARRDTALIRSLLDTGLRAEEMASIKMVEEGPSDSYLDADSGVLWVMGKNRRQRRVPLGTRARKEIDHYLFARAKHAYVSSPYLWIGKRGRMHPSGFYQMIESRCREAGIPRVSPHRFRHTFAHKMQAGGANDSDLMYLAGWKTRQMLNRYGASAAAERAIHAHKRLSPGDSLG